MTESNEQKEQVETIIRYVSEREAVSWTEARTMVHKYVCGGKCNWYQTKSSRVGFDRLDLSNKEMIEESVREFMKDLTIEEAKWQIHKVLCPGHPRPRPKRSSE